MIREDGSENLTFWELAERTGIEIPMLQRDYAQGREGKERIRSAFLQALAEAVDGVPVELDFVYGSRKDGALQPLDGQQRLTTLFLLHWYAARKEGHLKGGVKRTLKSFSYKTRTSSRDFCQLLVDAGVPEWDGIGPLGAAIEDAVWFCPWWRKDPTITSMLTMLDAIHGVFAAKDGLWGSLVEEDRRTISFNYIELEHFGLSDDLYIKMNARGRQLSVFECFKAGLEKRVEAGHWDRDRALTETFAYRIDTAWADVVWDGGSDIGRFDEVFTRLICSSALAALALGGGSSDEREKRIQELFQDQTAILPEDFQQEGYEYLRRSLDLYCDGNNRKLSPVIPFWSYLPQGQSFFSLLRRAGQMTYPQRVLLFAQNAYLMDHRSDASSFDNWMRVIRNVVHNSAIDSSGPFIMALNLVAELAQGSGDIYGFLAGAAISSNFASRQVKEEVLKARLMAAYPEHAGAIFEAEDTNFCQGEVAYLFDCIGYRAAGDPFDAVRFAKLTAVVRRHLSDEDVGNDFRRGLLTVGDNRFYHYWWSWAYAVDAHKHRLVTDTKDLKKNLAVYSAYLRNLLMQLIDTDLPELLANYTPPASMPLWKQELIQDGTYLDRYCRSHYIAVPADESCCWLLQVGRPRDLTSCKKLQ